MQKIQPHNITSRLFPILSVRKKVLLVTLVCTTLVFITYFQDITSLSVKGQPVYYRQTFIFHIKWLLWIPFTFLAINLAKKYPVDFTRFKKDIFRHLGLSVLFTVLFDIALTILVLVLVYSFSGILFESFNPKKYIIANWVYNFHYEMILYLLIVTVYNGMQYILKYQEEAIKNISLKDQVSTAQNQLLKMQMQPHFLFNTHHSIISLMALNKTKEASEMLTKLSDLLRKTLDMPNKEFVTLKEEVDLVRLYLDIQAIRFGDRLSIRYNLPEETLSKKVPVFIIQPLVENAIRHGIEPVSYPACISISSFLKQHALLIKIEDDGIGYNKFNKSTGIGITNIRERLKNHFQGNFIFIIEKRQPKGTVIEIEIPVIK
jgi:sensor histidine kinase YesM